MWSTATGSAPLGYFRRLLQVADKLFPHSVVVDSPLGDSCPLKTTFFYYTSRMCLIIIYIQHIKGYASSEFIYYTSYYVTHRNLYTIHQRMLLIRNTLSTFPENSNSWSGLSVKYDSQILAFVIRNSLR